MFARSRSTVACALLFAATVAARADNFSWSGNPSGNVSDPANWIGNTAPTALPTDQLLFSAPTGYAINFDNAHDPWTLNSLSFAGSSNASLHSSNTQGIQFAGPNASLIQNNNVTTTISAPIILASDTTFSGLYHRRPPIHHLRLPTPAAEHPHHHLLPLRPRRPHQSPRFLQPHLPVHHTPHLLRRHHPLRRQLQQPPAPSHLELRRRQHLARQSLLRHRKHHPRRRHLPAQRHRHPPPAPLPHQQHQRHHQQRTPHHLRRSPQSATSFSPARSSPPTPPSPAPSPSTNPTETLPSPASETPASPPTTSPPATSPSPATSPTQPGPPKPH